MESYLKERFGGVQAKNSSEEALRRWRRILGVVKNPKRRFRFTENLEKRGGAEASRRLRAVKIPNRREYHILGRILYILDTSVTKILGIPWNTREYLWRRSCKRNEAVAMKRNEAVAMKRNEAVAMKRNNIEKLRVSVLVSKAALQYLHCIRTDSAASFDLQERFRSVLSSRPLISCSQWEKGERIGYGSFGQVYRGFNSEHGRFCAIKEVPVISNDPRSKEQVRQLNQEICLLTQWSHPNIVQYYGSIMTDTTLSIYMEHVSKGSIHKLLANYGPFKESMICSYTAQILSGLAFLHERRHIHRDIKGANILVGPNNEVKLADFGLAKHIATLTEVHTSNRGTPCWMAPEVILSNYTGKGYNLSADIWSLGCTVIEMATGKPPLHGYEPIQAIFKIANDKTYIPEIPDVMSDEGKNFLQLCLQRDPASRPSAAQLMDHQFIRNQGS